MQWFYYIDCPLSEANQGQMPQVDSSDAGTAGAGTRTGVSCTGFGSLSHFISFRPLLL